MKRLAVITAVILSLLSPLPATAQTTAGAVPEFTVDESKTLWGANPASWHAGYTPGDRLVELTVTSTIVPGPVKVRLILPAGWSPDASRTWPTLWLLHGGDGGPTDWTGGADKGDAWNILKDREVITVMPDGSTCGGYSDWLKVPADGKARKWETFHLTYLRRYVEEVFHAGTERAIAGLSMGGGGAMLYAARNPGMFKAAASFSGALDSLYTPAPGISPMLAIKSGAAKCGVAWTDMWGDPAEVEPGDLNGDPAWVFKQHNPASLADRLRGVELFVSTGDGHAGSRNGYGNPWMVDVVEQTTYGMALSFYDELQQHDLNTRLIIMPYGRHDWSNWNRQLQRAETMLMTAIGA